MHALKIEKELQRETCTHIAHQNLRSLNLAIKLGAQWIGNNSWIGVQPKAPLKLIPLWGHL